MGLTKPIDPGDPSTITLPDLTKSIDILCSRRETHWCIWSGAGGLTRPYQSTVLAVCHRNIALPIITSRGVKYTHNDISHNTVHTHSGGAGIRPIPTEHTHEAMRGLTIDPDIDPEVTALFRRMIRRLVIVNIIVGTFTLFNLYMYPQHIYQAPDPVLSSPHVDTLHPHEI